MGCIKFRRRILRAACSGGGDKCERERRCGSSPEWLNPDEITLPMAERLIAYKKKISEEWLEKQNNNKNDESENETESDDEPIKKDIT